MFKTAGACALITMATVMAQVGPARETRMINDQTRQAVVSQLTAKHVEERDRIERVVGQTADLWRAEDGTPDDFTKFCLEHFLTGEKLEKTFSRLEKNMETVRGHIHQINRTLSEPLDLDLGEPLPIDYIFAKYSPGAHVADDFFANKLAFIIRLNFPYYPLREKLARGPGWSRKQWAHARLGDMFKSRVPAKISQKRTDIFVEADNYISEYNIYMGNLLNAEGQSVFPKELKLISHWGLRDELKSQYANPDGLARQKLIFEVMRRIAEQTIPREVVNSDKVFWDPAANQLYSKTQTGLTRLEGHPEPLTRYKHLNRTFQAEQLLDPYVPTAPTLIARRFEEDRQIPEKEVEALFVSVLSSPVAARVGRLIESRLGRKLEPFDIWYDGFKSRGSHNPEELDRLVKSKYPSVESFQKNMPGILRKLGFSEETARFLNEHIVVDPSRGAGHATGAQMRSDKAHLRTRATGGLNYKGYNIAIHEMGHTVEQVFSLNGIDYYFMEGVPNTAFTEAFAFVFQDRDLSLLGLATPHPDQRKALKALDTFWSTYEIAGVALVDMAVWRWMYEHPDAAPEELRDAVLAISKKVWNDYYSSVFGVRDVPILAVYSHMIDSRMYLPDYPLGHIISFQIEDYLEGKNLGTEMERMCKQGALTPSEWMKDALGSEISTKPLLEAAEEALGKVEAN